MVISLIGQIIVANRTFMQVTDHGWNATGWYANQTFVWVVALVVTVRCALNLQIRWSLWPNFCSVNN